MQQRHSHEKRCGKVREDGRMERSPRRLFRSQGLHLPEGEDAGVGNYFLECVRPAEDWPEPISNLPNRISHEVSSCPFPKRSVVWKNHSDSSATSERIIRAKRNCKGPGRFFSGIFLSTRFHRENRLFELLEPLSAEDEESLTSRGIGMLGATLQRASVESSVGHPAIPSCELLACLYQPIVPRSSKPSIKAERVSIGDVRCRAA